MKTPRGEEELFHAALRLSPSERSAFLERECAGDAALQTRLHALLSAHEKTDRVLPDEDTNTALTSTLKINDLEEDEVGQTIERYKLLEKLGEGGCGVVYVAEQTKPIRRRVALKLIKPGMDSKQVVARFEAERQALALMDHPNIAKVLDAGVTATGQPFFVMELVRGVRITQYCDEQELNTTERLQLFIKVCQAIQHAHQKGIIHRDIKPSNILVTLLDGVAVPMVIDFGIAKATQGRLTDATVYTQLHQFMGTPAYMSPEQAEMTALDIDTRSDIYSLGVLLYELLTGKTPFDVSELLAQGIDAIRRRIRETEPLRPSIRLATLPGDELTTTAKRRSSDVPRLFRQVSGDLDWIVMKCLEKDRSRRYETANGLAADLRRHLTNEPVIARPPSALYRFHKAWRRHRLLFAGGTTVMAALVISLWISLWSLGKETVVRKRAETAELEQGRERAKADTARQVATEERDRAARLLSLSQAEHGLKLLQNEDPVGLLHLVEARKTVEHLPQDRIRRTLLWSGWFKGLPKPNVRVGATVPHGRSAPYFLLNPSLSHLGGPWMATGTTNGDVILLDAITGDAVTSFSTGSRPVGSPDFSLNGRLLVVNAQGLFQLWDLAPVRSNLPPRRLISKVMRYAFDARHRRVVTCSNQGIPEPGEQNPDLSPSSFQVQIWDSSDEPSLISTWDGDRSDLSNHDLALSVDGSRVAAGFHSLTLWNAKTGQRMEPQLSTNVLTGVRDSYDPFWFSPNNRWLWEVRRGVCVRYDLITGEPVGDQITELHRYRKPWISPAGKHLVAELSTGFQVMDMDTGQKLGPMIVRDDDSTLSIALSADGTKLATSGPNRAIRVWHTIEGRQLGRTLVPPARVQNAAFTPEGDALSMAGEDGLVRVLSLTPQPSTWIREWPGVKVIGFNERGELLTFDIANRNMQWCNPITSEVSLTWSVANGGTLVGTALSPDGGTVAGAFRTGNMRSLICLWNARTGKVLEQSFAWTNAGVITFSPDGRTLAGLGGEDGSGSIQLWDLTSGRSTSLVTPAPMQVSWVGLRYSPDGRFLAALNSYAISVWDVTAGRLASGKPFDVLLAISDDWKWALGEDLLDFSDPRHSRPAPNPASAQNTGQKRTGLALSSDGRLRASESGDRKARLWDNLTGRPVGQEMVLSHPLRKAEFSPDNRILAGFEWRLGSNSHGSDKVLRLWDTSSGLPCGPAIPLSLLPTQFLFDREIRCLVVTAPFDETTPIIIDLPDREVPLSEMERQSLLVAGSRLDGSGNPEPLSQGEIRRLEKEAPGTEAASNPKQAAAPVRASSEPAQAKPVTSILPLEISSFFAAKEQQTRTLAGVANGGLPPELGSYFQAALTGDWQQASNSYASFTRRIETGPFDGSSARLMLINQAVSEVHIVLEHYLLGKPKYAAAFGRDIVNSLPPGSIYFAGSDSGRGLVGAFSQGRADAEPVFVLTQNNLADSSYLDYLRQTYGERIKIPTPQESQAAFQRYLSDAQRRWEHDQKFPAEPRQVRPGEEIRSVGGQIQIAGQVAVMGINALLARTIFDNNPGREIFVEESLPLDWMYPHLEPHDLILKLNRQPLTELAPGTVARDSDFWTQRLRVVLGDWLHEETQVFQVCDFIERVYAQKELKGFSGDRDFVTDPYAAKNFAKLRSTIAGVYRWRADQAQAQAERERMLRASDFAFRQALALCPYSPEVVFRYIGVLTKEGRVEDALRVTQAAMKFPPTAQQAARISQELQLKR